MGSSSGPRNSSKDGLVFALDAGDTNTITRWSTFKNMSTWSAGPGGASGYSQNGGTDENERVEGTDPFGNPAIVWESRPNGNGNNDGGWNADFFSIDNTKLYRFSVWVKRTSSTGGGTFYLGTNGGGQCVRRLSDGGLECNPYWHCGGAGGLDQNQWYLVIGHCFPFTYNSTVGHPDTGFWTTANGGQKVGGINGCNLGADCKSDSATTSLNHRTYHFYCDDNTTRLQWHDPRVDLVDGTEPKVRELLKGPVHGVRSPFGNTNFGRLVNGTFFDTGNRGRLVFDGSNDFISFPNNTNLDSQTITMESWINPGSLFQNGFLFEKGQVNTQYSNFFNGDGTFYFRTMGLSNQDLTFYIPSYIVTNTWNHIVCTLGSGVKTIYVNGSIVAESIGVTGNMPTNSTGLFVGAYGPGASYFFNGKIAISKVYNRAILASEVAEGYENYRTRFILP